MLNKWILTLLEDFAFGAINYTVCTEIEMTIAEELWVSPHYCCMNSAQPVQSSCTFFRWHLEDECKQSNRLWKPIINPRYPGRHNYVTGKLFFRPHWRLSNCGSRLPSSQQNAASLQNAAEQRTQAPGAFWRRVLQLPGDSWELNWIMKQRDALQPADILMNVKHGGNEMVLGWRT